jgi:hypothetical protein
MISWVVDSAVLCNKKLNPLSFAVIYSRGFCFTLLLAKMFSARHFEFLIKKKDLP